MSEDRRRGFYVLGVGGGTETVIDLLERLDQPIEGLYHFAEGRTGETLLGYPILGSNTQLFEKEDLSDHQFALSMGDNDVKMSLGEEIRRRGGRIPSLIHPTAEVSRHA